MLLPNIISYKGFKALAFLGGVGHGLLDRLRPQSHVLADAVEQRRESGSAAACGGGSIGVTRAASFAPPAAGRGGRGAAPAPAPPAAAPGGPAPGAPGTPPPAGAAPRRHKAVVPAAVVGRIRRRPRRRQQRVCGVEHRDGARAESADRRGPQPAREVHRRRGQARAARSSSTTSSTRRWWKPAAASLSGVYAIDLADNANTVTSWDAKGARIAGALGPAFGAGRHGLRGDRRLGRRRDLRARDRRARAAHADRRRTGSPPPRRSPRRRSCSRRASRTLVAASNADGSLYVLDAASLGGARSQVAAGQVAAGQSRRRATSRPGR